MNKLYIIAGPTASGKTAVAVELAKLVGGEVVSADSMQIYEGMDIGTAKPSTREREGIPHHMIDIVKPDEPYSAALYQQHARNVIAEIHARGRMPILCGGTGFYINAVIYDVNFAKDDEAPTPDTSVSCEAGPSMRPASNYCEAEPPMITPNQREYPTSREHFADLAAIHGSEKLHAMLQEADPAAAMAIHPNNIKRVSRALSYIHTTGLLFSEYNTAQKVQPPVYDNVFCRLSVDRPVLYERINRRALAMFDAGLVDEVAGLMASGCHPGLVSMQGIGYKEVALYVQGQCTLEEAIEAVKQNSRRYAKRQETWFRNQNPHALAIPAQGQAAEIAQRVLDEVDNG
ncbi:MAG: tRNA (adenosine(37)-N6)-dimethylallyltransferase MiaA [Defluviitaleaceae bacterium]|nr:tRNA (adenosine(37)-N6)-dimethylallyltransferase MiaA [Defluviitaleaceae bacterium]